jgi:hypothetical protein
MGGEVCYLEGAPAPCLTGPVLEDARESAGRPFFVAALLLLTAFVAHLAVSRRVVHCIMACRLPNAK